jgi:hypothetical protein
MAAWGAESGYIEVSADVELFHDITRAALQTQVPVVHGGRDAGRDRPGCGSPRGRGHQPVPHITA